MVSGNDAANTLAHVRSGTVPAFVRRMNARARVLGLRDSAFSNPSGLYDTGGGGGGGVGRIVIRAGTGTLSASPLAIPVAP